MGEPSAVSHGAPTQNVSSGDGAIVLDNPFASRHVRPGAIPFFFPDGVDTAQLAERFESSHRRGAIVGPHGSGKSTLLAHLADEFRRRGLHVKLITNSSCAAIGMARTIAAGGLLLVDGWGQLSPWRRWIIRCQCRWRSCGLLVTSHRPLDLPVLLTTGTSLQLAHEITSQLAGPEFASSHAACVHEAFVRHHGNLREVLFDLYDRHERTYRIERGAATRRP